MNSGTKRVDAKCPSQIRETKPLRKSFIIDTKSIGSLAMVRTEWVIPETTNLKLLFVTQNVL